MSKSAFHPIFSAFYAFLMLANAQAGTPCAIRRSSMSEFADFGCDLKVMTNECKNWFYQNPETLPYARDCQKKETNLPEESLWLSCASTIGGVWTELAQKANSAAKVLDWCNTDLECKKQLAKEAYFVCYKGDGKARQYPCIDEKQLMDISASDLVRKRENVRMMADRDQHYRDELIGKGVPLPEPHEGFGDFPIRALFGAAESELKDLGVKVDCYNAEGRTRMACYGFGTVVDPLLVAGAGGETLRGAAWAARVMRGLKTGEKVAAVASDVYKAKTLLSKFDLTPRPDKGQPILFGQKAVSPGFSAEGSFKAATLKEVVAKLKSGELSAKDFPIQFIWVNGQKVAVNNRSLTALTQAGLRPEVMIDMTGRLPQTGPDSLESVLQRLEEMNGSASSSIGIRSGNKRDTPVGETATLPP